MLHLTAASFMVVRVAPRPGDKHQYVLEHRDLGQLEGDVAAMADDLGAAWALFARAAFRL